MTDGGPGAARVDALRAVFDESYVHFWGEELGGDRLEADLERVRAACHLRPGMSVLDIGCAYGRIANRLAADGLEVTGVDQSSELLRVARERAGDPAPTYIEADMRTLALPAEHDAALLWFSTFGYFDDRENQAVLERAFRALRPGGVLAIETRNWDRINRDFVPWSVRRRGNDLLIEEHEFDPATGRQNTRQLVVLAGRQFERSYHLRRYTAAELTGILRAAAFEDVALYGEDLTSLSVHHDRVIAVGVRPVG